MHARGDEEAITNGFRRRSKRLLIESLLRILFAAPLNLWNWTAAIKGFVNIEIRWMPGGNMQESIMP